MVSEPLVVIDFREQTLTVLGERLVVASAMSDQIKPGDHPGVEPGIFAHFTIPAGENGWWVEFGIDLEDAGLYVNLCGEPFGHWVADPDDILIALLEAGAKDHPPVLDEYDSMCSGLEPGTWHDIYKCWPERWEWPCDTVLSTTETEDE